LYVVRIAVIIVFALTRAEIWLFLHQVVTGWTALALLWAAVMSSRATRWRRGYALAFAFPVLWSYFAVYRLENFLVAVLPGVIFLSFATFLTGWVFLKRWRLTRSRGAAVLAGVLIFWGFHHLDYPFLRARGTWNPWGYYIDILLFLGIAAGILMLLLDELDRRTRDLEFLSSRIVRQHEDERHRISLELHDQSAQVWAAVKLQLGLVREESPPKGIPTIDRVLKLVDSGIQSIRAVTTNLRPPLLDDLGLLPALRAQVLSFTEQTGLKITFSAPDAVPPLSEEASLAIYRALQEGLANTVRHSGATEAAVRVSISKNEFVLCLSDNGCGLSARNPEQDNDHAASHGLFGMRQRVTALHGSMELESTSPYGSGTTLTIRIPIARDI
jgi:signal transduction histidine kinase